MKWEYRMFNFTSGDGYGGATNFLNSLGKEGWEIFEITISVPDTIKAD